MEMELVEENHLGSCACAGAPPVFGICASVVTGCVSCFSVAVIELCDQSNLREEEELILTSGFKGQVNNREKTWAAGVRSWQVTSQSHKGIRESNLKWGRYELPELRPSDVLPPARPDLLKVP